VIARSVSSAAVTLSAARAGWQSEADLSAGIELGAAAVLKLGEGMRSADAVIDLPGRRIAVRVTNERARIDLNSADASQLARLLESNGVLESAAAALADAVIEWRGKPETPTLAATPATPQQSGPSRPFLHPWQLASVPGFPASLVKTILPLVTVASASEQVDPFIASERVLRALPGTSAASVDAFLDARDGNSGREAAILLLGVRKAMLTTDAGPGWRIEVSAQRKDGRVRLGEAVITVIEGESVPYRILYALEHPSP
jgi:general secretion pathway protein K